MKIKFKVIAAVMMTAPLLFTSITTAQVDPIAPPPGSTFAQRLDQRKKERAIQLDVQTQNRLLAQCIPAQANIRLLQQKLVPMFATRIRTYQTIDAKLWVSIGQLKLANKDTYELEKRRVIFADKTNKFKQSSSDFQQSLDDLGVINCQADVPGFKALLDTARTYLGHLREQIADNRSYVVDSIKPLLNDQVTSLQPKAADTGGQ
ncbi:MAG: hypothetical protein NVSMB46_02570 [Candidatus Saccharimonadales bacterium]